jgi:membrane associated rhomboid family serine protease
MLYLWIFGNRVEGALGHGRFLAFYLVAGLLAALVQTAAHPDSPIPMIGASGAVAGVLGAYLILFPRATILTLVILGFFIRSSVPAIIVLGVWFLSLCTG